MLVERVAQWIWQAMGGTRIEVLYTLLVFVAVFLTVLFIQWFKEVRTLPPGPWGLPIIGDYRAYLKSGYTYMYYNELAKKYGPIFSIRIGKHLVVVISDHRLIRETFRREEFTGRPHNEFINILDGYGIINTEGQLWKEQRRFLHDKLRNFGMSHMGGARRNLESKIKHEVENLIRGLELRQGAPTNISASLSMSISNVICSIIMGTNFNHGDPQFKRFMNLIEEGFKLFGKIGIMDSIPIIRRLRPTPTVHEKIEKNRQEMADFFQERIDEHAATFNKDNIRDIVDHYLLDIKRAKEAGRDKELYDGKNPDRQMQQILGDLFSAGMETIKTTLLWSIALMLRYPKAAKAVQEELDQVVGRSRMPSLEDLPYLPITEATIQEIFRKSSIVPLGTPHATTRDVVLNGYKIPAGTEVLSLLYAVHRDPELWDDPEDFRPERFLTAEGKVYKPDCYMPFGVGRRMCLGDVLAKMEIFLFFSSIMHSFDLKPNGDALPSLQGNPGITVTPTPFKVCFLKRSFDMPDCEANEVAVSGPLRNVGSH